jgi:hypothetical protein
VGGLDETGTKVAERVANLALAANPDALISVSGSDEDAPADSVTVLRIGRHGTTSASIGRPVVRVEPAETLVERLLTAVASVRSKCAEIVVELDEPIAEDERGQQRAAVRLLDAVCAVFD